MNSLQNSHKSYKILSIKYAKKLKNPGIHICIFITLLSFSVRQTKIFLNVAGQINVRKIIVSATVLNQIQKQTIWDYILN